MTPLETKLIALLRDILSSLKSQEINLQFSYRDKLGARVYPIMPPRDRYLNDTIAAELKTWEDSK